MSTLQFVKLLLSTEEEELSIYQDEYVIVIALQDKGITFKDISKLIEENVGDEIHERFLKPLRRDIIVYLEDADKGTTEEFYNILNILHALGLTIHSLRKYLTFPKYQRIDDISVEEYKEFALKRKNKISKIID